MQERRYYKGIDGVRTYSILGILAMHVLLNARFQIQGFFFKSVIPAAVYLVFLFMMVSAFATCCGYYEKFKHCTISPEEFYKKRYAKLWPFFAVLCLLDILVSPSKEAIYECFANLTLVYGLLPNQNIKVIGVGWTLGVIFVFYLLFPFYCFLIERKRRAWGAFAITVVLNYVCSVYFFDANHVCDSFTDRSNILYCACYFMAGGLIYIYRNELEEIVKKYKSAVIVMLIVSIAIYFMIGSHTITMLPLFSLTLIYSIGVQEKGLLINKFTEFISGISFEIYLSHMVVYRVLEKMKLIKLFGDGIVSYVFVTLITLVGTIFFSVIVREIIRKIRFVFACLIDCIAERR